MTQHLAPSETALALARTRDFGEHRGAYPVNRSRDRSMNIALAMLVVLPVPLVWSAYESSPLGGRTTTGPQVLWMVVIGVFALVALVLAVWLGIPGLLVSFSHPHATVHLFERGAVAVRHRGGSYSWRYENTGVRHVIWQESWEGGMRDRQQLWLTFRDGESICFDGLSTGDGAVLPDLAAGLGGNRDPAEIGELRSSDAPPPF